MSNSVRPQRRQPTRLPRPWDSPGKNTEVGCHFLLQCMKVKSESEVTQSCPTLHRPHGLQPTKLPRPWDSPGKSIGVGCHRLLQCKKVNTDSTQIMGQIKRNYVHKMPGPGSEMVTLVITIFPGTSIRGFKKSHQGL